MSRTYATPLDLELSSSRRQDYLLLIIYSLAVLSVILLPWSLVMRLTGLITLLLVSVHLFAQARSCRHIMWQSGNNWLVTAHNITNNAVLLPGSLVTPFLIILLFRLETGRKQSVLIWPDSLQPDLFRRLRVRLKLEAEKLVNDLK